MEKSEESKSGTPIIISEYADQVSTKGFAQTGTVHNGLIILISIDSLHHLLNKEFNFMQYTVGPASLKSKQTNRVSKGSLAPALNGFVWINGDDMHSIRHGLLKTKAVRGSC